MASGISRYGNSSEFGPSVCIETEFGQDWDVFFNYTSTLLSDARGAKGFESCNCKRGVRGASLLPLLHYCLEHSNSSRT